MQSNAVTISRRQANRELLQFRRDEKLLRRKIVLNAQHIRLAAHLAVFHIALPPPRRLINRGHIPLPARRALKSRFHLFSITPPNENWTFRIGGVAPLFSRLLRRVGLTAE